MSSLVVLAGLPGAGKTTLLRRLSCTPGVRALDAEDVARRLRGLPYRLLRPLVHAAHLLRVLAAAGSGAPCVLTSDPRTSPVPRVLLRTTARPTRRRLVVVLVHVTAEQARAGQRRRGRALRERAMRRHERRDGALLRSDVDAVLRPSAAPWTASVLPLMVGVRRPPTTEPLMDTTPDLTELEVLTDDELALVVGGADVRGFNAQDFVYNKIGMCGCGLTH